MIGAKDATSLKQMAASPQYDARSAFLSLAKQDGIRRTTSMSEGSDVYVKYTLEKGGKRLTVGEYYNDTLGVWKLKYRLDDSASPAVDIYDLPGWVG